MADGADAGEHGRQPGPRALHHVGLTVSDLAASAAWYEDLLGDPPTPVSVGEGERLAASLGFDEVRLRYAFLRIGGVLLELVEYERPPPATAHAVLNNAVGAGHVCFEVDDIGAFHRRLVGRGVQCSGPPREIAAGPLAGVPIVYFVDPDGIQLQAIQLAGAAAV